MKKILTMMGTRPEIIKLSPLIPLLRERFAHVLVHSGQHYSQEMDAVFFEDLGLPQPNYSLNVGSASHGEQTARMLSRLEPILLAEKPAAVLVQGDTNTTMAGGLGAAKLGIPVVHLEAGGRSFNRAMPEELNRVIVDHLSALLLAADEIAERNLRAEGLPSAAIRTIGSSAIDAVLRNREFAERSKVLETLDLDAGRYLALTLHRAENTTPDVLPGMVRALNELANDHVIAFPLHPRTAAALAQQGLSLSARIRTCEPLGYLDMLKLVANARALLTDSGGLQEEAAVLGTPGLIIRNETEWRYLVDAGVNVLVGNSYDDMITNVRTWLQPEPLARLRNAVAPIRPGASERAVAAIAELVGS
ncbi:MAG: UDP-N-acetylglucosamine 2-epimerase (non-hydrolyzing) [Chloroflexaceae bacterium]|jgi:UDP-N-acetylglucosamine 2-epimerase (non-hydrolysing)|nr:UDP-N-acetylglucosamine 2-epimerase (non-hydrolyzing) [Chloroflexaceae bacterium]